MTDVALSLQYWTRVANAPRPVPEKGMAITMPPLRSEKTTWYDYIVEWWMWFFFTPVSQNEISVFVLPRQSSFCDAV